MPEQNTVLGKRILLVDDDQGARAALKLLLSIDRHTVVEATNGKHALALLSKKPFDLVIMDFFMPEMQGSQLAATIKRNAPTLPILMVTAYFEKLVDKENFVDAIVAKPFGVEDLRQAIAKLLK
jgi:CheY-like chemotaxis protein